MNLSDLDYPLPKDLIAQRPLEKRGSSRLLVVDRKSGNLTDKKFSDIEGLIPCGDVLVINDTKVFPARMLGKKKGTGGKVDVLLLGATEGNAWRCLVQPSLKEGQEIVFDQGGVSASAVFVKRGADGIPVMNFNGADARELAEKIGTMPLPPYIKREAEPSDMEQYQTVFAEKEGAVAAPTAGLHFSRDLIERLRKKGVEILTVTLHVGYGTFKPVEDLENHRMHSEEFELTAETAEKIDAAKAAGKRSGRSARQRSGSLKPAYRRKN